MLNKFKASLLTSVLCVSVAASTAFASGSGAYRLEVADAGVAGQGSAFVGEANTPAAVYFNPAGLTQISGQAISLGASLIQPKVNYKSFSGEETQMRQGSFLIPSGYYVTDLGNKNVVFGIGAISSWGLTTYWNQDTFARYNATRSILQNQDYLFTTAYKINDKWSLGIGLDVDASSVDKQKKILQANPGVDDANFRLKGSNTAAGFRLAGLFKANDQHQFGLMYRSRIEHKYHGKVHLDNLNDANPSHPYQSIFGSSSYETDVVSKSTLPDSIVLGYCFKPTSRWTLDWDLEWMNWSIVNEEELAYPGLVDITSGPLTGMRGAVLNDGNPIARDWRSALSTAVGAKYALTDTFRLRTGYFYHQSPVPGATWEANLPDADSHGVTTGFGYDIRKDLTLDLAWSAMYYKAREVENTVASGTINGTYRQWINLLYATLTYRF
ncbi:MAG: outer membrane protein transport protein [Candidatus Omnitrophota bacterium]